MMNYLRRYVDLCMRGVGRKLPKSIHLERHHIIPQSMGGTNDPSNICWLTVKEHWLAHCLLVRIFPKNYNLITALDAMVGSKGLSPHRASLRLMDWQKRRITAAHVLRREDRKKRELERKQLVRALNAYVRGSNNGSA